MTWSGILHLVEVAAALLVVLAGIYYAQLLFRAQRTKVATELAKTTISQQDATITAQGERIDLQNGEIRHLKELIASKDLLVDSQGARIGYLENVVTARDLIETQGKVIHAGFSYLQVPAEVLAAAAAG